jgi:hypothetical protein
MLLQAGIGIPSPSPYMNRSPLSKFHSKAPVFGELNKLEIIRNSYNCFFHATIKALEHESSFYLILETKIHLSYYEMNDYSYRVVGLVGL